ncbi:hypothetical protein BDQ17DRAFT_725407 [Cyathus striatus]|nr:hypothetical protein BDQ17DRAFT_725407 [Cyathus striatus]
MELLQDTSCDSPYWSQKSPNVEFYFTYVLVFHFDIMAISVHYNFLFCCVQLGFGGMKHARRNITVVYTAVYYASTSVLEYHLFSWLNPYAISQTSSLKSY